MGKITIVLPDGLGQKFRRIATIKFGLKKGYVSEAGLEAIKLWIDKNENLLNQASFKKEDSIT